MSPVADADLARHPDTTLPRAAWSPPPATRDTTRPGTCPAGDHARHDPPFVAPPFRAAMEVPRG